MIEALRARYGLPVWQLGSSRGTNSVANAAIRLKAREPDGIVLTATTLRRNNGDRVLNDAVAVPALIVHHETDACRLTAPDRVARLRKALKNAHPVKVLTCRDGSGIRGNPCQAYHYHGFTGIEAKVVADIMAWIKSPAPSAEPPAQRIRATADIPSPPGPKPPQRPIRRLIPNPGDSFRHLGAGRPLL